MLRSYLTIALRNARRDGVFSLLNVIGLAIGLACGILILLYVQREFSYDRHHAKADRIHRVFTKWTQANGETSYGDAAQGPVGPMAQKLSDVGIRKIRSSGSPEIFCHKSWASSSSA